MSKVTTEAWNSEQAPHFESYECPSCGHEANRIREEFVQATRTEPMRSLGWYGYCRSCDLSFKMKP